MLRNSETRSPQLNLPISSGLDKVTSITHRIPFLPQLHPSLREIAKLNQHFNFGIVGSIGLATLDQRTILKPTRTEPYLRQLHDGETPITNRDIDIVPIIKNGKDGFHQAIASANARIGSRPKIDHPHSYKTIFDLNPIQGTLSYKDIKTTFELGASTRDYLFPFAYPAQLVALPVFRPAWQLFFLTVRTPEEWYREQVIYSSRIKLAKRRRQAASLVNEAELHEWQRLHRITTDFHARIRENYSQRLKELGDLVVEYGKLPEDEKISGEWEAAFLWEAGLNIDLQASL